MKHIHYIKSSQEWICPETGKWKIICVGGGSSGGMGISISSAVPTAVHNPGGATSFGSYLTAAGYDADASAGSRGSIAPPPAPYPFPG